MNLQDMKKVELHLHLEGGAPPGLIQQMAFEKKLDISRIFTPEGGYSYRDFWHFLDVYEAATSVLQSPEDFARLTRAVLEQSASHGVVYSEAFLSPDFCGGREVGAWKEYLAAIQEAAEAAERDFGITLRGIITHIRHFGPEKARQTAACAQETAGDWIVGYGMGGDEKAGTQKDFAYSFDMAREAGLRLTTHAGEWGGAAEVRAALDHIKPERIGHGVEAIYDDALVDRLAESGVVLECCPGSNVFLGVFKSWPEHPIQKLRQRGVRVTVSTDDPPFFGTTMTREYEMLAQVFGWEVEDFRAIAQASLDAAFCGADTRAKVQKLLEA